MTADRESDAIVNGNAGNAIASNGETAQRNISGPMVPLSGRGAGWRGPHYGGGLLGLVLIVQLVLWVQTELVPNGV